MKVRTPAWKWAREEVKTRRQAERQFRLFRPWVWKGCPPLVPPERLLRAIIDDYIPLHMVRKKRSYEKEKYRIAEIRQRFGAKRVSEIGLKDVEQWVFALQDRGCGPATIKRGIARLKAIMNWAYNRDECALIRVRWRALDLDREPAPRSRRFLPDEEARVMNAANPILQDVIHGALDTGLRYSALMGLRFRMVDQERRLLTVPRSMLKNRHAVEDLELPLTRRMMTIIAARWKALGSFAEPEAVIFGTRFGGKRRSIKTAWQRALDAAGVPRNPNGIGRTLHFHDLRAEHASRLGEVGVGKSVIGALLDHSPRDMTARYVRVRLEVKREAIEQLEVLNERFAAEREETPPDGAGEAIEQV